MNRLDLIPLRAVPTVAIALATVLFTLWLAAADLKPHSLYADPPGAAASR
jgi:hypothetical protein